MAHPREIKEYWVARACLFRAAQRIPADRRLGIDDAEVPDPWVLPLPHQELFDPELSRPALLAVLDRVATIGASLTLRGGFWRDLMRVAQALGETQRGKGYRERFRQAVRHVGNGPFDDTEPRS